MYVSYKHTARVAGALSLAAFSSGALAGVTDTTVTFENGTEGFVASGAFTEVRDSGGNTGAHVRTVTESFGVEWWTDSNSAFLGDYTQHDTVTLSIDVRVDQLQFFGQDQERSLVVELRNSRYRSGIFQYGSVFFELDENISAANTNEWTTFSVTFNPNSDVLPEGWGGYGGSDDADGPVLPDGATFSDVLTNIDLVSFSTLVPVERYPFTNFDISADNISISTVPAPSALALLAIGGTVGTRRRRN